MSEDLTTNHAIDELDAILYSYGPDELQDAHLRVEFKVFQDEAQKVDKERIKNFFLSGGAKEVDVKLIPVSRENTRSKNILKLIILRDKLIEQAALKKETVPEPILLKADSLESETSEKIIAGVIAG